MIPDPRTIARFTTMTRVWKEQKTDQAKRAHRQIMAERRRNAARNGYTGPLTRNEIPAPRKAADMRSRKVVI